MSNIPLIMFLVFIAITLGITYWASRRSAGASAYFAASRQIKGWQNGIAVAGDYMSAASFLGIAGIIAFQGYDGFLFSVGWLVAYLTVLLVIAEPLRNAGKYTMADVLAYRLKPRPVRAMASLSTLTVSTFYMIAQMVGAGALVKLLLGGQVTYNQAVIGVGHSDDRLCGVRRHAGDHVGADHQGDPADGRHVSAEHSGDGALPLQLCAISSPPSRTSPITMPRAAVVVKDFLQPGLRYKPPYGPLDLISLGLALIFGTAGLPHILVRFYTVPDAKTARNSVVWAMVLIGSFYIMTTFLGFGAATIVGPDFIKTHGGTNMSAPLLAQCSGWSCLLRLHLGDRVRHDSGGGRGTDDQRNHLVRARFLDQRDPQRSRAETGRGSAGGAHLGVCGRRGGDRIAIVLQTCECGVPGGAGICGGCVGELAGDCAVDLLAAIQHRRARLRGWRWDCWRRIGLIIIGPSIMGDRSANRDRRGAALDSSEGAVPAGESRHTQHSVGIHRGDSGHADQPRTNVAREVQRVAGAVEYRVGRGKGYGTLKSGFGPRPPYTQPFELGCGPDIRGLLLFWFDSVCY